MAKSKVSPTALMREMSKVSQIRSWLGEDRDIESVLATIESESDALEKLDLIVDEWESDRTIAQKAKERAARIERRADKGRYIAQAIMEQIGVSKLERPGYTASIGAGVPSLIVTDADRIPRQYMAPDKAGIKAVLLKGQEVPGCTLNNVPPVLRIRTK